MLLSKYLQISSWKNSGHQDGFPSLWLFGHFSKSSVSFSCPGSRSSWTSINTKLLLVGFVTNYGQLLAMRFCLGMAESGLFPGISFFLSGWYRRKEASKRISLFFAGAVLAGAFGGIFGCKWISIIVSCEARTKYWTSQMLWVEWMVSVVKLVGRGL